jgi:hypothetical protein
MLTNVCFCHTLLFLVPDWQQIIDNDPHISVLRDMSQLSLLFVHCCDVLLGFVRFLLPVMENNLLTRISAACPSDCTQQSIRHK